MTATAPLPDDLYARVLPNDSAVADTRHVLDYFRKSEDRRMLFAGRETYFILPRDIAAIVRPRMERVYPALKNVRTEYARSAPLIAKSTSVKTKSGPSAPPGERYAFHRLIPLSRLIAHGYSIFNNWTASA